MQPQPPTPQLHALVMSFFASLISPFGGFFASGFKRAFKLKDFGDTIPGHGGLTDRFDCQVGARVGFVVGGGPCRCRVACRLQPGCCCWYDDASGFCS
jgi:hypothetical protein